MLFFPWTRSPPPPSPFPCYPLASPLFPSSPFSPSSVSRVGVNGSRPLSSIFLPADTPTEEKRQPLQRKMEGSKNVFHTRKGAPFLLLLLLPFSLPPLRGPRKKRPLLMDKRTTSTSSTSSKKKEEEDFSLRSVGTNVGAVWCGRRKRN